MEDRRRGRAGDARRCVASYRQTRARLPQSAAATTRSRPSTSAATPGITVASALLVDYVLTVAVSISSGAQYAAAAMPSLIGHEALVAVVARGGADRAQPAWRPRVRHPLRGPDLPLHVRDPRACAAVGLLRCSSATLPQAESAHLQIEPAAGLGGQLPTVALLFLLARAFSSGCAALTGVEAISNGVPAFRKPKSRNAATTLLMLGLIAISMMMSVIVLASADGAPLRRPARARPAPRRRRQRRCPRATSSTR